MTTVREDDERLAQRAREAAETVCDPEIPVLTIADLGVLREVRARDGKVEVLITPTYSGCPAMAMIQIEVETALEQAGIRDAQVRLVLSPAWTTDWLSDEGRRKLRDYGIAPPDRAGGRRGLFGVDAVTCPHCGSLETGLLSAFGSTACKALWRCQVCREPFDYFKCH